MQKMWVTCNVLPNEILKIFFSVAGKVMGLCTFSYWLFTQKWNTCMYARDEMGTILITVIEQTKTVSNHYKTLNFSCVLYIYIYIPSMFRLQ
jgi:hypothetical protein